MNAFRGTRTRIAAALVVTVGGGWGLYRLLGPRTVAVRAAIAPSFRSRPEWRKLLDARFAAVSDIHGKAGGPHWKVVEVVDWECAPGVEGLDACRTKLRETPGPGQADVVIGVLSRDQATRRASTVPFSKAAVLVDLATESEEKNRLAMAHELAHLFAATHLPATEKPSLMSETPANTTIDARTAALLHGLARFDFKTGLENLDAAGERKVVDVLSASLQGGGGNAQGRAHQLMGLSLRADGRYAAAIKQLLLALKADPANPVVRYDLAAAYAEDHQTEPAVEHLQRLVEQAPDFPGGRAALAAMLAQTGRSEEALVLLDAALQKEPSNPLLHLLRGSTLSKQIGRMDDAIAALQKAVDLAPNSNEATRNLARAKAMKQQWGEATRQQQEKVKLKPNDAASAYNLGVALAREGKLTEAIAMFRRALALNPKMGEAHANLATMFYLQHQYGSARQEIETAQQLGVKPNPRLVAELSKHAPAKP